MIHDLTARRYISPVSTLLRWFPDRRGLATGLALTAFGGGAAVAAPAIKALTDFFFVPPTFLGSAASVPILMVEGRQQATVDGVLREVVVATQADITQVHRMHLVSACDSLLHKADLAPRHCELMRLRRTDCSCHAIDHSVARHVVVGPGCSLESI